MNLDFQESAAMARKIVTACADTKPFHYIRPFVLASLEQKIARQKGLTECADTQSDYFGDCFGVLREATQIVEAWETLWSDAHHNGRPTRWLKFGSTLAMQGKTESLIVQITRGSSSRSSWKENWELHRRDREAPEYAWKKTAFSIVVHEGNWIDKVEPAPHRPEKGLGEHVLPGLEILGYKTPVYGF